MSCFDDEVSMITLDRVVDDTEVTALAALGEGALQLANDTLSSEGGDVLPDLQRDVTRKAALESFPAQMSNRRILPRSSSGTRSSSTPGAAVKRKLAL